MVDNTDTAQIRIRIKINWQQLIAMSSSHISATILYLGGRERISVPSDMDTSLIPVSRG